ncbi:MAG: DUF5666 domain-containing protein [Ktedonobacteraceae bacterium]
MEDYEDATSGKLVPPSARHRGWRSLLLVSGLALAFMLALGIGVLMGSTTRTTQAASFASVSDTNAQAQFFQSADNNNGFQSQAFGPRAQGQGQCEAMTVSSVSSNTIVAKTASGSSVTIHTTASTKYTKAGATASASAIKAGTRIQAMGTHNSDGSITATSIDIG